MSTTAIVDAGFLVALLSEADAWHSWAVAQVPQLPRPWITCEAALSESFLILEGKDRPRLAELLRRGVLTIRFDLSDSLDAVLALMSKYADAPMSLADACMVRMSETLGRPLVVTTDSHFRIYRRHSRQVIPVLMP